MSDTTEKALSAWGMSGAECRLVATRENHVYRVDWQGKSYALRLHRKGYRTDAELNSELKWMAWLADHELKVPTPLPASNGALLTVINGFQIDMLSWLSGTPLGASREPLNHDNPEALFFGIGREMARLHLVSDKWDVPSDFSRPAWDRAGLVGDTPLWDRFWDNPTLTAEDRTLFQKFRVHASERLRQEDQHLDYGLIHADLVRENVMIDGDAIQLIDFDDGGFGFRQFDLATTLLKNRQEPSYPALKRALLEGYQSVRDLDTSLLDLFLALRATTYVGWIITRLDEDGSDVRNQNFIKTSRDLVARALDCL